MCYAAHKASPPVLRRRGVRRLSTLRGTREINWDARKKELEGILDKYRSKDGSNWDCVVPVSGGKDSTYQVIRMLQLGMNPLCVTGTTCDLSEVGRKNIQNLQNLGVDYIEVTTNRVVRRKLNKIGLTQIGDISWPEHISINTIPVSRRPILRY